MTLDEERLFNERAERLEAYRQRIAALEAELVEARKDVARLDWLERKGLSTTQYAGRDYGVHSWLEPVTGQLMWTARYRGSLFCSLRSAVDAARGAK